MASGGHFGLPKISFDRISRHFRSIHNSFFFTKWLSASILDDRKSLFIAFLPISDQYATFFFSQNGCPGHFGWPKITFDRISRHFRSIRNFYYFDFFHKMAASGHFGWPKITFDRISRHFRSMRNLKFFSQDGSQWPFWMTENYFWSHFLPFQINTQLWFFLFAKWLPAAILDDRKSLSTTFTLHFRSIRNFDFFFKSQNGSRRPCWMTENHFRMHFSPFQINTQLFFFKWSPAAILEVWFAPKTIGFFHYVLWMAMPNMKLIGEFMTQLEMPQAFWAFLHKMATRGHFVFPIDVKNHRVLIIWDLNGYGEYEFERRRRRRRRRRRNQKHNITEIFKFRGYNNDAINNISVEATPHYLWDYEGWEEVPGNHGLLEPRFILAHSLHQIRPDLKFLLIFRNPVSR